MDFCGLLVHHFPLFLSGHVLLASVLDADFVVIRSDHVPTLTLSPTALLQGYSVRFGFLSTVQGSMFFTSHHHRFSRKLCVIDMRYSKVHCFYDMFLLCKHVFSFFVALQNHHHPFHISMTSDIMSSPSASQAAPPHRVSSSQHMAASTAPSSAPSPIFPQNMIRNRHTQLQHHASSSHAVVVPSSSSSGGGGGGGSRSASPFGGSSTAPPHHGGVTHGRMHRMPSPGTSQPPSGAIPSHTIRHISAPSHSNNHNVTSPQAPYAGEGIPSPRNRTPVSVQAPVTAHDFSQPVPTPPVMPATVCLDDPPQSRPTPRSRPSAAIPLGSTPPRSRSRSHVFGGGPPPMLEASTSPEPMSDDTQVTDIRRRSSTLSDERSSNMPTADYDKFVPGVVAGATVSETETHSTSASDPNDHSVASGTYSKFNSVSIGPVKHIERDRTGGGSASIVNVGVHSDNKSPPDIANTASSNVNDTSENIVASNSGDSASSPPTPRAASLSTSATTHVHTAGSAAHVPVAQNYVTIPASMLHNNNAPVYDRPEPDIWKHFERNPDGTSARCNYCLKTFKRNGKTTTNFRRHHQTCRQVPDDMRLPMPPVVARVKTAHPRAYPYIKGGVKLKRSGSPPSFGHSHSHHHSTSTGGQRKRPRSANSSSVHSAVSFEPPRLAYVHAAAAAAAAQHIPTRSGQRSPLPNAAVPFTFVSNTMPDSTNVPHTHAHHVPPTHTGGYTHAQHAAAQNGRGRVASVAKISPESVLSRPSTTSSSSSSSHRRPSSLYKSPVPASTRGDEDVGVSRRVVYLCIRARS